MSKIVKVEYDATKPETKITADGKEFDTSRIRGKEIEDWAYPLDGKSPRLNSSHIQKWSMPSYA